MLRVLLGSFLFLFVFFVLTKLLERHLVFFPSKIKDDEPGLQTFRFRSEEVWMTTADGVRIHGWFVPHDSAVASVVMAHGNAGNVWDRAQWLAMLHEKIPINLFMFDYRGYGKSAGTPNEDGCYRDAEAAYDWLKMKAPQLPLLAHGHSLGGAVVVELAGRRHLDGLIVESSFTHARDMTKLMFGPLPVHWLTSMKWASSDKIGKLILPKLFLHGTADSIIPFKLGQELYAHAAEPKQFMAFAGLEHNEMFMRGGDLYYHTLREFIFKNCVTL